MNFEEVLDQALEMLQRRGRVTYQTFQLQFKLDDKRLEALKDALLFAHTEITDEGGRGLVWTSDVPSPTANPQPETDSKTITPQTSSAQIDTSPRELQTPDAERRQLTVMFCDIVGSTSLSGELDPEDLREVVKAYQSRCTEVIQRYDGYVAQLLGDGLLVYFGYPVAHEDDAQRAVRTGLGIVEAIRSLNTGLEQEKGLKLAVRLGIHTGLVVVGDMGGEGRQEQLALGETPNISARIQGLAKPNTLIVSEATYRLIQGYFDCDALGEHELRGVAQSIPVYQVLQESGAQDRLDVASIRGLTPLVGRHSELQLLRDRWHQVKSGEGQVVLLKAEPGLGKSRMVQALREHLTGDTHTRLECRSSPYYQNTALYPVIDLIQRTLPWEQEESTDDRISKLERTLSQYCLPVEETVPLMVGLLSLPLPEDKYAPLNLTPQRQRQKTLETIVAMLLELAAREPVLFIVEDLHWTDPSTLELLGLLVDQIPTASICMLLTCRPEFQPEWGNQSYFTQITLNRLSHDDVEQMVAKVTGGKSLPDEVIQQLVAKTDGVPLYVEEMTKSVLESGLLKESDGQYESTDSISTLSIPATLQDSLMARLDRLVSAKAVAQYASVIGRQFSYELLQAVSELDETTLQRELGRLVEAELVYQRGISPQTTYTFKHALIQDTAYESLLRSTRQGYHRRIAEVLAERFEETAAIQPELVAHHYTEAKLSELAIEYWHKAGQMASGRSAHIEAIAHLTRGLKLLKTLPDTSVRRQQELALQTALAPALVVSQGFNAPEVEYAYTRAYELCQKIGETPQLVTVLRGLARFYFTRGELQTARELGEQLLTLAQHQKNPEFLLDAYWALGGTLCLLGDFVSAHDHLQRARTLYDTPRSQFLGFRHGAVPGIHCLAWMSWTLWVLGYPDQALECIHEALTLIKEFFHPYTFGFVLGLAIQLQLHLEQMQDVKENSDVLITLATEHGFPQWLALGTIHGGWVRAMKGEVEDGVEQIRQSLPFFSNMGGENFLPYFLSLLAQACGNGSQVEEGVAALTEALALGDKHQGYGWKAEVYRLKGELLLQQSFGNEAEAESCFHQALEVSRYQQAKSLELRAATSLSCLWQSQGKGQDAYDLLAPVYNWFTEGFGTADLQEAKVLLTKLEEERVA